MAESLPGLGAAPISLSRSTRPTTCSTGPSPWPADSRCRASWPTPSSSRGTWRPPPTTWTALTDLHHEALAERVERVLRTFSVDSLEALAALAEPTPEGAVRLLGCQRPGPRLHGLTRRDPARRRAHQETVADLRADLGDRPFRQAWAEGAA